jgi:Flp pilus assembly pilin Flp
MNKFRTTQLSRSKSRGQGMTEYIIIVALIAIAAIGVYSAFGNVIRGQTGAMAAELGGKSGATSANNAGQAGDKAERIGQKTANLSDFQKAAAEQR